MLDRGDLGAAVHERGGETRLFDQVSARRNILRRIEIRAAKDDAGIGRCALKRDLNADARMKCDARGGDVASDGVLLWHGESIGFAGSARMYCRCRTTHRAALVGESESPQAQRALSTVCRVRQAFTAHVHGSLLTDQSACLRKKVGISNDRAVLRVGLRMKAGSS